MKLQPTNVISGHVFFFYITQDDRTCWMEAIKPGSSKQLEHISISSSRSDKDEELCDDFDDYAYALSIKPPAAVKSTDSKKTREEGSDDHNSEEEENLYDYPDDDIDIDNRPPMHLPERPQSDQHTQAIAISSPPSLEEHYEDVTVSSQPFEEYLYEDLDDQMFATSAEPHMVTGNTELHGESDQEIEEDLYDECTSWPDDIQPLPPPVMKSHSLPRHPVIEQPKKGKSPHRKEEDSRIPPPPKPKPSHLSPSPISFPPLPKRPPSSTFKPPILRAPPIPVPKSSPSLKQPVPRPLPPSPPLPDPKSLPPFAIEEISTLQKVSQSRHSQSISKSSTIPRVMSSLQELSIDNLSDHDLTPNEVQVWMLLQMQKMVQKMEDVYETGPQAFTPHTASKRPVPPPPLEETHHSRQQSTLYANMDALEVALSNTPPPPLPPRTYKSQPSGEVLEFETGAQGSNKSQPVHTEREAFPYEQPHGKK